MSLIAAGMPMRAEHDVCLNRTMNLPSSGQAAPAVEPCEVSRARFDLRALAYRRIAAPRHGGIDDLSEAAAQLGEQAAHEARRTGESAAAIDDYVVTSTIMSALVMDGSAVGRRFLDAIAACAPRHVDWIAHGYECAGWGYVLRYVLAKAALTGARRLLLQIVDVDIHRFTYWLDTPHWGHSGFGICTLVVDVHPGDDWPLRLGAPAPANAMVHMGQALRAFSRARPGVPVAVPFFKEASRRALLMYLDGATVLPDGFARFGHAFGSDPWISLLLHACDARDAGNAVDDVNALAPNAQDVNDAHDVRNDCDTDEACDSGRSEARASRSVIVNSLALDGYFAIAEFALSCRRALHLEADVR
jgi:hypothetical protein